MNKRRQIQRKCIDKIISINHEDKIIKNSNENSTLSDDIIPPSGKLNINIQNGVQDLTPNNDIAQGLDASTNQVDEEIIKQRNNHHQDLSTDELICPVCQTNKIIRNDNNEVKILQDKLAQSNARLYECKNSCLSLRQEINKAQKIICSEIGDNVTIASLSHNNNSGGWKGRSEQIQHLQQKIIQLQNKFNNHGKISRSSSVTLELKNNVNMEIEKRRQHENLSRELKQAEIASESYRKKLEGARARIKILENDLFLTKSNLIMINEKKKHDEQLIEALNGQLRAVETRYRDKEIEIKNQRDKLQINCDELKNELTTVKFQVEKLRKKIGERETEIDTLKLNKSERVCESVSSTRTSVHESSIDTALSAHTRDPNEYVILALAAEAERERLLELVTVLNQRLDKERTDTDHVSELLRCEKNKNTKLEKKLEQLELVRIKISRINPGYRAKITKSLNSVSSSKEELNTEEIYYKLELLEEKCLALNTRLMTVQQDKESDLKIYKHMLENTNKIFQDACRNNMTMARGHSTVTI